MKRFLLGVVLTATLAACGTDDTSPDTQTATATMSSSELTTAFVAATFPRLVQPPNGWQAPDSSQDPAPGEWILLGESPTGCEARARMEVEASDDPENDPQAASVAAVEEVALDLGLSVSSSGDQFVWRPSEALEASPTLGFNLARVDGTSQDGSERVAARRDLNYLQLEGATFTVTTTTVRLTCDGTLDAGAWDELFSVLRIPSGWDEEPGNWTVYES